MMSRNDPELSDYIADLEYRLSNYHQWLEQAIADRDRLALDAAWGVEGGLLYVAAFAATIYVCNQALGLRGFWWLLTILAAQFVGGVAYTWSNRQRMKEVDRLPHLPEWQWKDPSSAER
jgi:hypothetical protein